MFYKDYLNYDGFKTHCVGTEIKLVIWPRRCHISQRWLWLELVYRQTAMWTGPGEPVFEYRWYDRDEFLVASLRGDV